MSVPFSTGTPQGRPRTSSKIAQGIASSSGTPATDAPEPVAPAAFVSVVFEMPDREGDRVGATGGGSEVSASMSEGGGAGTAEAARGRGGVGIHKDYHGPRRGDLGGLLSALLWSPPSRGGRLT